MDLQLAINGEFDSRYNDKESKEFNNLANKVVGPINEKFDADSIDAKAKVESFEEEDFRRRKKRSEHAGVKANVAVIGKSSKAGNQLGLKFELFSMEIIPNN